MKSRNVEAPYEISPAYNFPSLTSKCPP